MKPSLDNAVTCDVYDMHTLITVHFLSLRVFDEFFPNVYSQLQAHGFLIHTMFLRKNPKTHCHLRLKFPTFTHDRSDLKLWKKALNFKGGRSSKLSNADEAIPGPPFMATSCHMIRRNFFQPQCFILSSEQSNRISECLGGGIFHDVRSCRCTDPVKKEVVSFFFFFFREILHALAT